MPSRSPIRKPIYAPAYAPQLGRYANPLAALRSLPGLTLLINPADGATLFSDRTGGSAATPAAFDGPVGTVRHNATNLTTPTDAARMTLRRQNGAAYLEFDGTDDELAGPAISSLITAGAYEIGIAGRFVELVTNTANVYDNDLVMADAGGFFAAGYARSTGHIGGYNWDTNADSVQAAYTANTDFVWLQRHDAGNLVGALNGGAEVTAASGNTSTLTNILRIGRRTTNYARLRIYGIAICNAVQTAENRSAMRRALAAAANMSL